jgi:DNA-binding Lrp family transcriptional regulator
MPLKLDKIDTGIIKCLMDDGRRSLRQIAREVDVTTPTVENRLRRMLDSGLIRKISPVLDIDKIDRGIAALMDLRVDLNKIGSAAATLTPLEEVRNVFLSTGEANMIVRVVTRSSESLQDFIDSVIAPLDGVHLLSSQMLTRTMKDEQGSPIFEEMSVTLKCDYCSGEVSGRPFILDSENGKRFFCCKTCLGNYKTKYKSRIAGSSLADSPTEEIHEMDSIAT